MREPASSLNCEPRLADSAGSNQRQQAHCWIQQNGDYLIDFTRPADERIRL
jgi:hypothetical protein